MNNKIKKLLPGIALIVFTLLVWPWPETEIKQSKTIDNAQTQAGSEFSGELVEREEKPVFQSKNLPETLKKKEVKKEQFKVTNPKAIEYNEQADLVMTQGPGKTPAISETDKQKATIQSAIEAKNNPKKYASRLIGRAHV